MTCKVAVFYLAAFTLSSGQTLPTKAHVSEVIRRVENGVDEFRDYLNRRGENARGAADRAGTPPRRNRTEPTADARRAAVDQGKDELDNALGDLNRSTNRLRRAFDMTDKWMETRSRVERVLDDGRRINQVVARGRYGSDVAKLWAGLRTQINDLARVYNLPPLAI